MTPDRMRERLAESGVEASDLARALLAVRGERVDREKRAR